MIDALIVDQKIGDEEMTFKLYYVKANKTYVGCPFKHFKTDVYIVRKDSDKASSERLGLIKWKGAWRQYVFYPDDKTMWSSGCLQTIIEMLKEINKKWRLKKRR